MLIDAYAKLHPLPLFGDPYYGDLEQQSSHFSSMNLCPSIDFSNHSLSVFINFSVTLVSCEVPPVHMTSNLSASLIASSFRVRALSNGITACSGLWLSSALYRFANCVCTQASSGYTKPDHLSRPRKSQSSLKTWFLSALPVPLFSIFSFNGLSSARFFSLLFQCLQALQSHLNS